MSSKPRIEEKAAPADFFARFMEKDRPYKTEKALRSAKLRQNASGGSRDAPSQHNTPKETEILNYIAKYEAFFAENYDDRKLMLRPLNEFGVPKFISSFIRPTLSQNPELHDHAMCALILSDYFQYEDLETKSPHPTMVVSPATLLKCKAGDSVDLAVLAASFLEGAGFDAFVVYGTARLELTRKDESTVYCPFVKKEDLELEGLTPPPPLDLAKKMVYTVLKKPEDPPAPEVNPKKPLATRPPNGSIRDLEHKNSQSQYRSQLGGLLDSSVRSIHNNGPEKMSINSKRQFLNRTFEEKSRPVLQEFDPGNTADIFQEYRNAGDVETNPYVQSLLSNSQMNYENYIFGAKDEKGQPDTYFLKNRFPYDNSRKYQTNFKSFLIDDEHKRLQRAKQEPPKPAAPLDSSASMTRPMGSSKETRTPKDQVEGIGAAENSGPAMENHFWLLVRPNTKRDIKESLFVDVVSGRMWSAEDPQVPFGSIKQIFNSKNCWINLNESVKIHHLDFSEFDDLKNDQFEFVLNEKSLGDELMLINDCINDLSHTPNINQATSSVKSPLSMGQGSNQAPSNADPENTQRLVLVRSNGSSLKFRPPELQGLIMKKSGVVEAKATFMSKENSSRCVKELIQVPHRWVPSFEAEPSIFKQKFAKNRRQDFYRRVQVERFTENSQPDNLVKRVSIFADFARVYLTEVRSYYLNRTDNLRLKTDFPFSFKSVEYFDPFSSVSSPNNVGNPQWREITTVEGHMVVFKYFNTRFIDGLVERTEVIGEKTISRFENRDDRLEYLSVRFVDAELEGAPREAYTYENRHCGTVRIIKMVEKFTRNNRLDDSKQIAKVVFDFQSNKIQVTYHPSKDPLKAKLSPTVATFNRELFTKVNAASGIQGAFTEELGKQVERLYQLEKDCLTKVRTSEMEIKEEMAFRTAKKSVPDCNSPEELRKKFTRALQSSIDRDRSLEELSKDSQPSKVQLENDVDDLLGQELKLRGWVGKTLTTVESEEVQATVLKEVQERFLERVEVMNHRIMEEKGKLEEMKQALLNYKKVHKQEEEPEKGLTDKIHLFAGRIAVLEERLINFKTNTYRQLQEVQDNLARDPRLKLTSAIR